MSAMPVDVDGHSDRGDPHLWQHDYLHLRPLAEDLEVQIGETVRDRFCARVLDLGSGASPYREYFGKRIGEYVAVDATAAYSPSLIANGESLPFPDRSFDAVLSTQTLCLVDDPAAFCREIARVMRPGGIVWLSTTFAYPFDSARPEPRFGEPDLRRLFDSLEVREIVPQGGMLALPFVLFNVAARDAGRSVSRHLGLHEFSFEGPLSAIYFVSNLL